MALKFLEPFNPEDIQAAVDQNIDLESLILENPGEAEPLSSSASLFDSSWTVGNILYWFAVRRPDLYRVLATEKSVEWIKRHWIKRKEMKQTLETV